MTNAERRLIDLHGGNSGTAAVAVIETTPTQRYMDDPFQRDRIGSTTGTVVGRREFVCVHTFKLVRTSDAWLQNSHQ